MFLFVTLLKKLKKPLSCSRLLLPEIFWSLVIFFCSLQDYKPEEDPALFHSVKTGRGPLSPEWKVLFWRRQCSNMSLQLVTCDWAVFPLYPLQAEAKSDCPHMCAYKLVTVKFRWWGLQTKVESFIQKVSTGSPDVSYSRHETAFLAKENLIISSSFFLVNPPLAARKAYFHQLPPPALLLDRQMGRPDDGGHPADGGGDPKRARGGN